MGVSQYWSGCTKMRMDFSRKNGNKPENVPRKTETAPMIRYPGKQGDISRVDYVIWTTLYPYSVSPAVPEPGAGSKLKREHASSGQKSV